MRSEHHPGVANAELASRIVESLQKQGLLTEKQWQTIKEGLTKGTLKQVDWTRLIEQVLDEGATEQPT